MKQLLFFALLLPFAAHSQSYGTITPELMFKQPGYTGGGITFTGGAVFKNADANNKRNWQLGLGIGLMSLQKEIYLPFFMETGYCNPTGRLSPQFNIRAGYAAYDGDASFLEKEGSIRGGFYGALKAGVSVKITRKFLINPFGLLTLAAFRQHGDGERSSINKIFLGGGIAFMIFK